MLNFKSILRSALPGRYRVPVKFCYLQARGHLEPEIALLPWLVGRGDRALDLGAHDGSYAFALRRLGCRVAAFEPNPAMAAALIDWADRATMVHAFALSDRAGAADLHIPRDGMGVEHDAAASIGGHGEGRKIAVAVDRLDTFGYRDAALIKIDVEGHEDRLLAGAQATIAASLPALIIEIEQRHRDSPVADAFAAITGLGYQGWFLRGGRLVPLADFDLTRDQQSGRQPYCNNFLFLARRRLEEGRYQALFSTWPSP